MNGLQARLRLPRGRFTLEVELGLPGRGVSGLFGPSGSGKTSVLRCLAGLERNVRGRVSLGGVVWQDDGARIFVPAHRRSVGYVFQDAELFPHLSVRGNLRYARKRASSHRMPWSDAVAWLGLAPLLDRAAQRLSGGERQRVAIARTLLAGPRLLLMDEPLSALDEVGRREIFPYLEALPARLDIPIVYVSHSLREVLRLADHMVWLVNGRVQGSGAPAEVVADPEFALWQGEDAAVVVDATVREHDDAYHLTRLEGPWGTMWVRRQLPEPGERLRVQIRAGDVSLSLAPDERTSILNQFPLRVVDLRDGPAGEVLVRMAHGDGPLLLARITRLSRDRLQLSPGTPVHARLKSVAVVESGGTQADRRRG